MEPLSFDSLTIYIYMGWGVLVQMLGVLGFHAHVIFVLRECIWNAPAVSFVLPTFHVTGSLGYPLRQVVYPSGSPLGDYLPFPYGE